MASQSRHLDRVGHLDPSQVMPAAIGDGLDARRRGRRRRPARSRGRCRGRARSARAEPIWTRIQHHRAGAGRDHVGKFGEMLGAALGDRVGKFGKARPAHQVHVLDLDIAGRPAGRFEQEIDPRGLAVFHLAADGRVAGELRDAPGRDRLGGERIGMAGVDADELGAAAEDRPRSAPSYGRACGSGLADFDSHTRAPGALSPSHRARIGAMHRHRLARRQHDVGEEALVALRPAWRG